MRMHTARQTADGGVDSDIVFADDFSFVPYLPTHGGDSGALQIATSKADSKLQYIVKSETPELACNEFIYHKITLALGLHTQEVKLFTGIPNRPYAAGIRYSPKAQKFYLINADDANKRDFFAFAMLYVVLNEEDSEEFYLDEAQRVFKLDNAASFNLDTIYTQMVLQNSSPSLIAQWRQRRIQLTEYDKYSILLRILSDKYGATAQQSAMALIERFSSFDEAVLRDAYTTLDASYPPWFSDYYHAFILFRQSECRRFLQGGFKGNE